MIFRYDFGEKLDLSKFRKQAAHYIGTMRSILYYIFVNNYKIVVDISLADDSSAHNVSISMFEIERDKDGEILANEELIPANDLRFKEIKNITNIFPINTHEAHFTSSSVDHTVDEMCKVIKIIHKINNLKVFL